MNTEEVNKNADIRKLATVATVLGLFPIAWADTIEHAQIRGWKVVVKKGQFNVGDKCIYLEIGSVCPDGVQEELREEMKTLTKRLSKHPSEKNILSKRIEEISTTNTRPEFEFLRQNKFLIKTKKVRGVISQGIVFPLNILANVGVDLNTFELHEGMDLTDLLGVAQYIEPEPANLGGEAKGQFPHNQLSSDEERIENLNEVYPTLRQYKYVVSEKLEGSSGNFFLSDTSLKGFSEFGVCSRNLNLKETEKNTFWKVARKLNIEEKMRKYAEIHGLTNFNIQGEVVGEGIQDNIYKLKGQTVRFYASFNIDTQTYFEYEQFLSMISEMGLETCPIIYTDYELPENFDDLFELVDNFKTTFGNDIGKFISEGLVFVAKNVRPYETITRSGFNRLSFKVKARTYEKGKY